MLSVFDPLARAISDWQRKHHIADGDPMIAAVELVRIYLKHSGETDNDPTASPPGFEDFRGTIELLDRRSKAFIHQATDLVGECAGLARTSIASTEHGSCCECSRCNVPPAGELHLIERGSAETAFRNCTRHAANDGKVTLRREQAPTRG
jgi:hypothetical protein